MRGNRTLEQRIALLEARVEVLEAQLRVERLHRQRGDRRPGFGGTYPATDPPIEAKSADQ